MNLFHAFWREYGAAWGGWMQDDPSLFGGGDSNVRRYGGNDPVNMTDLQGLEAAQIHFYDDSRNSEYDLVLRVEGKYEEKEKKWTDTKAEIVSKSNYVTTEYIKSVLADKGVDLSKLKAKGKFELETEGTYYFIVQGEAKIKATQSEQTIPDNIVKEAGLDKDKKHTWQVLKAEVNFTLVKLTKKKLEVNLEARDTGIEVGAGGTIDAKQEGKLEIFIAPNPAAKGTGFYVNARATFGRTWDTERSDKEDATRDPGYKLVNQKESKDIRTLPSKEGRTPKGFDPGVFAKGFITR